MTDEAVFASAIRTYFRLRNLVVVAVYTILFVSNCFRIVFYDSIFMLVKKGDMRGRKN
jgi:hypothetical protein